MSDLPQFSKGEEIAVRGTDYTVETVDFSPSKGRVLQYRLKGEDHYAILKPEYDGGVFVIQEFHTVGPGDISDPSEDA